MSEGWVWPQQGSPRIGAVLAVAGPRTRVPAEAESSVVVLAVAGDVLAGVGAKGVVMFAVAGERALVLAGVGAKMMAGLAVAEPKVVVLAVVGATMAALAVAELKVAVQAVVGTTTVVFVAAGSS